MGFEYYYGYRRRSDLGAIIMLGIFIAVMAITIFVEYLLYGVVISLLDTYLPSLQPSKRFILAIVILVVLFPLLLYGFLLVTGFATIAAILIFVGTHTAREMMAELMRIVRRK